MLVAGPEAVYADHPRPADVFLLVEVADSTLTKDRTMKLPLYAAHDIPELWIVNLVDQQIEVYTEASGARLPDADHQTTDRTLGATAVP